MPLRIRTLALLALLCRTAGAQPAGSEFPVNTTVAGFQSEPDVAGHASGFVVVWQGPDGDGTGVFARRFSSSGAALDGELRVNESTAGGQLEPAVAASPSGSVVVVWTSPAEASDHFGGVRGRRYAADGSPVGAEFPVNSYTTNTQWQPAVARADDGSFVVVWAGDGSGDANGIFGRRFSPGGTPGADFLVNSYVTGFQSEPEIAMNPGTGEFVVVWSGSGEGATGIFARRFAALGAPVGTAFRVNTTTAGAHLNPSIAIRPTTALAIEQSFVVTWVDNTTSRLLAQRYSQVLGALAPEGGETKLADLGVGFAQAVSMDSTGDFVVAYQSAPPADDVLRRFVDASGALLGTAARVNTFTTSVQTSPAIATLGPGKHVIVWTSDGQDTDFSGIFGQRFNRSGDANGDGVIDVLDVFWLINFLFAAGPEPLSECDVNGSASTDVADVFALINSLFAGGLAPV
jgi:large repetitive protein